MPPAIGFVGFGEAGSRIAAGLREAGVTEIVAYDIAPGRTLVASNAELAARCTVILSVVTASSALDAARQNQPYLTDRHTYIDCNSVSPATKREIAAVIGSRFVEGAILAPVPKQRGQSVAMLVNGDRAAAVVAELSPLGFSMEVLSDEIGTAAAIKMCRSIVIKGMEALLTEFVLAASHFGAEERVFASLQKAYPGMDWKRLADYMVNRVTVHGTRRAREMEEVAGMLLDAGIDPIMSEATARRQQWAADLGLSAAFGPDGPSTYREVLAAIEQGPAKGAKTP